MHFLLSGNNCAPYNGTHFSPEDFPIFALCWRLVLLWTLWKTNTLTTMGKPFQHFPANFWNLAVCIQGTIVHQSLAHIIFMRTNFPIHLSRQAFYSELLDRPCQKGHKLVQPKGPLGLGYHPKAWFGRAWACLVHPSRTIEPKTAVNLATESKLLNFSSNHQGIRFLLSGNVCLSHYGAYFSPEDFPIFLPRWRLVLLQTSQKTNTLTTKGKLFQHFPATFWNMAVHVHRTIVHQTLAHISLMKTNF